MWPFTREKGQCHPETQSIAWAPYTPVITWELNNKWILACVWLPVCPLGPWTNPVVISLVPKCVTEIDILCSWLTPPLVSEPKEVRVIQEARNSQLEISETAPPSQYSKSKTILHPREMTEVREGKNVWTLYFLLRSLCFSLGSLFHLQGLQTEKTISSGDFIIAVIIQFCYDETIWKTHKQF